jgi:SAM-dependent methyltransferase
VADTDKAWTSIGADDPYWGVLTRETYARDHFDAAARAEFFATGETYVDQVFATIGAQLDPTFTATRALDFGCGVGRLTLPLARRAHEVVGVDVSPGMLAEATANATRAGLANTTFVPSDDGLTQVDGRFDLVHSFIVFQHIDPARGERIVRELLARLWDGGVGVLHLTYAHASTTPLRRRALTAAYERVPCAVAVRNVLKRRPPGAPLMEMRRYDLSRVLRIVQEAGCHDVHLRFTEASHFGHPIYGVVLHVRKQRLDTTTHS